MHKLIGLLFLCLSITACAAIKPEKGRIDTRPAIETIGRGSKIKISMPSRCEPDIKYYSAVVFVKDIEKAKELTSVMSGSDTKALEQESDQLLAEIADDMQVAIEAQLQRVKSLNIIKSYSKQTAELKAEELSEKGIYSENNTAGLRQINHIIALQLIKSIDEIKLDRREDMALYRSRLAYKVIRMGSQGATEIESGLVEGMTKRYRFYNVIWNRHTGDYVRSYEAGEEDFSKVREAPLEATCRAALSLASKLGNAFPVVRRIISWAGSSLELEAGEEDGVMDKQVFILYTHLKGRNRAFALAEVVNSENKISELKVIKWSKSAFAIPIIKVIRKDNTLVALRSDSPADAFYAASAGLPPKFFAKETCKKK